MHVYDNNLWKKVTHEFEGERWRVYVRAWIEEREWRNAVILISKKKNGQWMGLDVSSMQSP